PPTPTDIPIGNEEPSFGHPMTQFNVEAETFANEGMLRPGLRWPYWRHRAEPWRTRLRYAIDARTRAQITDQMLAQNREDDLPTEAMDWVLRWLRHLENAVRRHARLEWRRGTTLEEREQMNPVERRLMERTPPPPPQRLPLGARLFTPGTTIPPA